MAKIPNEDDLFKDSTMTFGEHLDELRVALFRSVVGLLIGFLLGLLVAGRVVNWIQGPLLEALDRHYEIVAEKKLDAIYGNSVSGELRKFMKREHLLFDELLVEPEEIRKLASSAGFEVPPPKAGSPAQEKTGPSDPTSAGPGHDGVNDSQKTAEAGPSDAAPAVPIQDAANDARKTTEAGPPDAASAAPGVDMLRLRVWRRSQSVVQSLSAQEPFMVWMKVAFVTGLLIASPYIFWQIWGFVAAGLYPHEKRYVHVFLPLSLALFWAGAGVAFFLAFRYVLEFLFSFNRSLNIQSEPRINEWIGFVLFLPLGFGIAFQMPLVMFFLNRIGIFSVKAYMQKWRIAILVIFVVSMVLTPADPISMLLMALPLTFLYFFGIGMAKWMPRVRNPYRESYDP